MSIPVVDLHCDLLCYLEGDSGRTARDLAVRCSIPQLRAGGVKGQVLAVYTATQLGSAEKGWAQVEIFRQLPENYPDDFEIMNRPSQFGALEQVGRIGILLAIENASSFCGEDDDLEESLRRLDALHDELGNIAYISMTWNSENRFGGGNETEIGLKEDGKRLLDFLHQKQIPIDFSHTSDPLAYDILRYLDSHQLEIPVLASHSNFRAVSDFHRNLPDDLAREIMRRGGVIGINFVRPFVGYDDLEFFAKQLQHGLDLGGEGHLCFGADFFYGGDLPPERQHPDEMLFFAECNDASSYGTVMDLWRQHLSVSEELLVKIANGNAEKYLSSHWLVKK